MLKKTKKGFTLMETIIALGILAIIAIMLLPALANLINNSNKTKDSSKLIFALETALEKEKVNLNNEVIYGPRVEEINGYTITINRSKYDDKLDKIKASHGTYELEVIEVRNE